MHANATRAILCVAFATTAGCQGTAPADSQEAMARVEAALEISNPSDRDDALAAACKAAAKIGASDAVLKGIEGVGSPSTRDQVAEECALALRECGPVAAANDAAKLIGSPSLRDKVLKKLASGS